MNKQELIKYYCDLLIKQYNQLPNATATIATLANPASEIIFNIVGEFNKYFNLETANGEWLNIIGQLIGLERQDLGSNVDDTIYRNFIKFKIVANISNTGTNKLENNIFNAFNGDIVLINNYNMSIDYIFNKDIDQTTKDILLNNPELLPHPTGVGIRIIFNITTEKIYGLANNNGTMPIYITGLSGNSINELNEATVLDNTNINIINNL